VATAHSGIQISNNTPVAETISSPLPNAAVEPLVPAAPQPKEMLHTGFHFFRSPLLLLQPKPLPQATLAWQFLSPKYPQIPSQRKVSAA